MNLAEPQFTQREASVIGGADIKTINNWIDRGFVTLTEVQDRRLTGRRLFSIIDIIHIKVMAYCSKSFGMPPSTSYMLAALVELSYINWLKKPRVGGENEPAMELWFACAINQKRPAIEDKTGSDEPVSVWDLKTCYRDPTTGFFMSPAGGVFAPYVDEPYILLPASRIAARVFLECADLLMQDQGHNAGTATQGLEPE